MPGRQVAADDSGQSSLYLLRTPRYGDSGPRGCRTGRRRRSASSAGRPLPGGRVEDHVDVAHPGLTLDQRPQRRVHLVDHIASLVAATGGEPVVTEPPYGHHRLPHRAPVPLHVQIGAERPPRDGQIPRLPTHGRPADQPGNRPRLRAARRSGAGRRHGDQSGHPVEGYWLQVLGPSGAWAEVVPPEVSVYPQEEASATVVFSPPSGAEAPGGVHPFGVIARPRWTPRPVPRRRATSRSASLTACRPRSFPSPPPVAGEDGT